MLAPRPSLCLSPTSDPHPEATTCLAKPTLFGQGDKGHVYLEPISNPSEIGSNELRTYLARFESVVNGLANWLVTDKILPFFMYPNMTVGLKIRGKAEIGDIEPTTL